MYYSVRYLFIERNVTRVVSDVAEEKCNFYHQVCLSLSVMIVISMMLLDILSDGIQPRGLLVFINI